MTKIEASNIPIMTKRNEPLPIFSTRYISTPKMSVAIPQPSPASTQVCLSSTHSITSSHRIIKYLEVPKLSENSWNHAIALSVIAIGQAGSLLACCFFL